MSLWAATVLSFTIASFHKGDLDRLCPAMLQRGQDAGFKVAQLTPAIGFDRKLNAVIPGSTIETGEVTRCLDQAWSQGLDIFYSPHVEDLRTDGQYVWRARYDFKPDAVYSAAGFDEFIAWFKQRAPQIRERHHPLVVNVATELEKSTTAHPGDWIGFIDRLRSEASTAGIGDLLQVDFQPNWWPDSDPTPETCPDFRALVQRMDLVAPSFYGDWSHTELGIGQAPARIQEVLDRLVRRGKSCEVPEFLKLPLGFGEIGIGSVVSQSERWDPIDTKDLPAFQTKRREIFRNLFQWLMNGARTPVYINFWTLGWYDAFGIDAQRGSVADEMILGLEKQYQDKFMRLEPSF